MQDLEQQHEQLFIKGFNSGYILAKYEPSFTKELLSGIEKSELPYVQGLRSGAKELKLEKFTTKAKDAHKKLNERDNDFGIER